MDLKTLRRLIGKALASGARRLSVTTVEWDVAGVCESPATIELHARPTARNPAYADWSWRRALAASGFDPRIRIETGMQTMSASDLRLLAFDAFEPRPQEELKRIVVGPGKGVATPLTLIMHTRCRRCSRCLKARARLWTARATAEIAQSTRTWFGTLTLRPEEQYRFLLIARSNLRARSVDYDSLSPEEQLIERYNAISPEITKYLKRVRKESAATLRYLSVCEAHKSGDPHFHMLVHETSPDEPVRKATLDRQWTLGFTRWRTNVERQHAGYVAKYLSKSAAARVRASQAYGNSLREGSPTPSGSLIDPPSHSGEGPDTGRIVGDN